MPAVFRLGILEYIQKQQLKDIKLLQLELRSIAFSRTKPCTKLSILDLLVYLDKFKFKLRKCIGIKDFKWPIQE